MSYSGSAPELKLKDTASSSADAGGAAGWTVAQQVGGDLSEPTINHPSEIRAYWTDSETSGNEQGDCASTEPFRAYWEPPKRADEWEAEVTAEHGASNVSFTMSNTGGRWPELTGTVRINGFSTVSLRVRGRFGDDGWGGWSPITSMYCNMPGGL